MLTISVESNIRQAMAKLSSITEAKQLRFAVARALTKTADEVQAEVRKNMPSRFTLRRQWIVKGIAREAARPDNLTARVYSRDKFMGLQEVGGQKNPLNRYIAVPTKLVRRTKTQVIAKADRPKALGDKAEIIEFRGNKWLALKRGRKAKSGNKLFLLYLLVPRAKINERLGLGKDGIKVAKARFAQILEETLADAIRTAR